MQEGCHWHAVGEGLTKKPVSIIFIVEQLFNCYTGA